MGVTTKQQRTTNRCCEAQPRTSLEAAAVGNTFAFKNLNLRRRRQAAPHAFRAKVARQHRRGVLAAAGMTCGEIERAAFPEVRRARKRIVAAQPGRAPQRNDAETAGPQRLKLQHHGIKLPTLSAVRLRRTVTGSWRSDDQPVDATVAVIVVSSDENMFVSTRRGPPAIIFMAGE
jgi:hypothetical protein